MIRPVLLCDGRMPKSLQDALALYGTLFPLPPHPLLPPPVCAHPDLLLFYDGEKGILYTFLDYYEQNETLFKALPVKTVPLDLRAGEYPLDLHFDQLLYKGRIIGRAPFIPKALTEGREVVHVRQGYAKCATLLLSDAAVTADGGIARAICALGGRTLTIENEGIALPGYDKGFIGGASAVVGSSVLFFGDLYAHGQGREIEDFLLKEGYTLHALCSEPLTDYGGLVVIESPSEIQTI